MEANFTVLAPLEQQLFSLPAGGRWEGAEVGGLIDALHLESYLLFCSLLSAEVHTAPERTKES